MHLTFQILIAKREFFPYIVKINFARNDEIEFFRFFFLIKNVYVFSNN